MSIETKQKKPNIGDYFNSLGIKECKSKLAFWKHVTAIDSVLAEELEPLISRKRKGNIYDVKNQTLPFSLGAESWTMSFHKSLLTWVSQQKELKPKRILEIGCDNGLSACWYAQLFPDTEIVGVDQSENGIQCARQLAKQLGLSNVSFYQIGFMELLDHFSKHSFDMIISVRSFHEIMGPIFIQNYWSLPDHLKEKPTFGDSWYLQIVDFFLTPNGTYLSCERLESPADVGKWANLLKEANLHVQWSDSEIIDYYEFRTKKQSPVIVATKKETGLSTLEGMEHLYSKNQPLILEAGQSYTTVNAEFAFHRLGVKTFQSGQYLAVPNHWFMYRFEVWKTNDFLLVYCYGNMGYRQLDILPAGTYGEAELLMEQAAGQFSHLGPIVKYNSLKDRPE
ncbi:methyltransferase domain-containing protein [Neobacillus sp. SAB-20_R2A]|uniref:methyltransferase domain-containing protein n=1 Tax=Neobacillus sp. SAB-20_R2A TaxID=3120519 RepID=UPI003C6E9F46